ncbi:MAG: VanW family protein [Lachnospiraceae bacterium]|nr:VanW family protein [Lachnospiraceae bacterium]
MWNKKYQRIVVSVIAILIALIMILTLVAPALAAGRDAADGEEKTVSFLSTEMTDTILPGIKVRNIDISGLTDEEAEARVSAYVEERKEDRLTIRVNGQEHVITLGNLGLTWTNPGDITGAAHLGKRGNIINRYKFFKDCAEADYTIPLSFSIVDSAVVSFVAQAAQMYNISSVEPSLTVADDGSFQVTPGQDGLEVSQSEGVSLVMEAFHSWTEGDITVDIPYEITHPTVSDEVMYNVNAVIGSGSTDFGGSTDDRIQNIVNAVGKVNNTVLMPGEALSLTGLLVPFDAENGYAVAPSYSGGTVTESYGGGVCQVSTTLYIAVMKAELQIDERHSHSMMVSYINPSMDAAIAEGAKDFRFTNNTDAPIVIKGWTEGTVIHFEIYGHETRPEGRSVEYASEILDKTPAADKIILDDTLDFGKVLQTDFGHNGMSSRLWKKITVNGETTQEIVNQDDYQMAPICYTIGVKGASPEAVAAVNKAIADTGLIGDAIAAVNANGGSARVIKTAAGESADDESPVAAANTGTGNTGAADGSPTPAPAA